MTVSLLHGAWLKGVPCLFDRVVSKGRVKADNIESNE